MTRSRPSTPSTATRLPVALIAPSESAHAFDITRARARCSAEGGREIVHASLGFQISVYTLVAPEPDRRQVHADDGLYIVLEGSGTLDVGGQQLELGENCAAFVPAGAEHHFSAYEHLTVLAILGKSYGAQPPSQPPM